MPNRFVAPRSLTSLEDVAKAFRVVQEQLDALARPTSDNSVRLASFTPLVPSFTRVSPQTAAGLVVTLPAPGAENVGLPVIINIEDPHGPVTIEAPVGALVNGAATSVFTSAGLVVFYSNGHDSWSSINQLSTTSPSATADVVLGTASASFPNGRVATASAEITPDIGTPNVISWALNTASVAFSKLADLTGLSVLGRAATTTGVMAAITSTARRQVLQNNDAGNGLQWGFPVEFRNNANVDQGDVYSIQVVNGLNTTSSVVVAADRATIGWSVDNLPLSAIEDVAAESFIGNFTAGVAPPTARAGSSVAGGGLTYTAGGTLAVGAGTKITVNANDVAWTGADARNNAGALLGSTVREWQGQNSSNINEAFAVVGSSLALAYTVNVGASFAWTNTHSWSSTATFNGPAVFTNRVQGSGSFNAALIAGNNNNLAIGGVSCVRVSGPGGGATMTLTGMVPLGDGQWVFIENTSTTDTLVIAHDNAASTAANRFSCPGNHDHAVQIGGGVWVRYDNTTTRWFVSIPRFIGLGTISLSPTTHTFVTALNLIEGTGINLTTAGVGGIAGNTVDLTIAMADMAANTIKANATAATAAPADLAIAANSFPARVGGNLVAHQFSVLAGAALSYSAGVIDVSFEPSHHITTNAADALIFRKARDRDMWWEDFTYSNSLSGGTSITTSGVEAQAATTNWWLDTSSGTGTWAPQTAINNHPGVWRLTTGNVANNNVFMHHGVAQTIGYEYIRADEVYKAEFIVRLPTVTSMIAEFGFGDSANLNYMTFVLDTNLGTTARVRTMEGGVDSLTDTGFTFAANAWNVYTLIQETVGTVDFYIDDVLEHSSSTNVPDTEGVGMYVFLATRTAATRSIDIDYISFESQDLGARTS